MKIKPIVSEKSLADAKEGKYSFWVEPYLTKGDIKKVVSETFNVHVGSVKTISFPKRVKRNYMGRKIVVSAKKKATVTIGDKEKIDVFEEKKK